MEPYTVCVLALVGGVVFGIALGAVLYLDMRLDRWERERWIEEKRRLNERLAAHWHIPKDEEKQL